MTTLLTSDLITRCHEGSKAKGFWDITPPQGQQLMLVVSELAESLEAHRKNYRADNPLYEESIERISLLVPAQHKEEAWAKAFVSCYKDTVEDELADAYIRLCDFAGGFAEAEAMLVWYNNGEYSYSLNPNFGGALLQLVGHICDGIMGWSTIRIDQLAEAVRGIEALADREGIDLATHIDLKLRYNATRGRLHEKLY